MLLYSALFAAGLPLLPALGMAILGGLALGLLKSLRVAYLSSAYKDVIAFVILLVVLFVRPNGLVG